nr:hypothetical protein [Nonomuraea sp. FMUSA5-5]
MLVVVLDVLPEPLPDAFLVTGGCVILEVIEDPQLEAGKRDREIDLPSPGLHECLVESLVLVDVHDAPHLVVGDVGVPLRTRLLVLLSRSRTAYATMAAGSRPRPITLQLRISTGRERK